MHGGSGSHHLRHAQGVLFEGFAQPALRRLQSFREPRHAGNLVLRRASLLGRVLRGPDQLLDAVRGLARVGAHVLVDVVDALKRPSSVGGKLLHIVGKTIGS